MTTENSNAVILKNGKSEDLMLKYFDVTSYRMNLNDTTEIVGMSLFHKGTGGPATSAQLIVQQNYDNKLVALAALEEITEFFGAEEELFQRTAVAAQRRYSGAPKFIPHIISSHDNEEPPQVYYELDAAFLNILDRVCPARSLPMLLEFVEQLDMLLGRLFTGSVADAEKPCEAPVDVPVTEFDSETFLKTPEPWERDLAERLVWARSDAPYEIHIPGWIAFREPIQGIGETAFQGVYLICPDKNLGQGMLRIPVLCNADTKQLYGCGVLLEFIRFFKLSKEFSVAAYFIKEKVEAPAAAFRYIPVDYVAPTWNIPYVHTAYELLEVMIPAVRKCCSDEYHGMLDNLESAWNGILDTFFKHTDPEARNAAPLYEAAPSIFEPVSTEIFGFANGFVPSIVDDHLACVRMFRKDFPEDNSIDLILSVLIQGDDSPGKKRLFASREDIARIFRIPYLSLEEDVEKQMCELDDDLFDPKLFTITDPDTGNTRSVEYYDLEEVLLPCIPNTFGLDIPELCQIVQKRLSRK